MSCHLIRGIPIANTRTISMKTLTKEKCHTFLLNNTNLDFSKVKTFSDNKLNVSKTTEFTYERVENLLLKVVKTQGKGLKQIIFFLF